MVKRSMDSATTDKKYSGGNILGWISIGLAVLLFIPIINFVLAIIPTMFQGIVIFFPIFVAPFGFILGFSSFFGYKNKVGLWGMILNVALFLLPFAWMYLGTLIFGP